MSGVTRHPRLPRPRPEPERHPITDALSVVIALATIALILFYALVIR